MRVIWASKGWRVSCPLRLLMTSEGSDDAGEAGSSTYEPSVAHRVSRGWMLQSDMGLTRFKCKARTCTKKRSWTASPQTPTERTNAIFTFPLILEHFAARSASPLNRTGVVGEQPASGSDPLYIRQSEYRSPDPYQPRPPRYSTCYPQLTERANSAYTFKHRSDFPVAVAIQSPPCT